MQRIDAFIANADASTHLFEPLGSLFELSVFAERESDKVFADLCG